MRNRNFHFARGRCDNGRDSRGIINKLNFWQQRVADAKAICRWRSELKLQNKLKAASAGTTEFSLRHIVGKLSSSPLCRRCRRDRIDGRDFLSSSGISAAWSSLNWIIWIVSLQSFSPIQTIDKAPRLRRSAPQESSKLPDDLCRDAKALLS